MKKYTDEEIVNNSHKEVMIDYVNWKGERSWRRIIPDNISFGSNEWHKEPQWLLSAFDIGKKDMRSFAINTIMSWDPV